MTISLDIEIYLSKKNFTAQDAINNLLCFAELIQKITHAENWFSPGYSEKKSLEHKIIDRGVINHPEADSLIKKLNKTHPIFVTSIWNYSGGIRIQNYSCDNVDNFRLTFSLEVENNMGLATNIKNVLLNILNTKDNIVVMFVNTNQYQLNNKHVFPDRIPVGWMLYLNKQITNEQAGVKAGLISVSNEKNTGTLVISTNEVFDGTNENHVRNANEIEIQLAAHGLLPTYQNIYD